MTKAAMIEASILQFPSYNKFDKHLLVDFIELRCIMNLDRSIVLSELKDIFTIEDGEVNLNFDLDAASESSIADQHDRNEGLLVDLFRHMHSRQKHYDDRYPFTVKDGEIALKETLDDGHMAYLYLLLCSHLKYIAKEHHANLTSEFEYVSLKCLEKLLVEHYRIFIFGKNSKIRSDRYKGNAIRRLEILAEDLGGILRVGAADFPTTSTGDSGIDIIGWFNPWDQTKTQPVLVAQCKCSDEWPVVKDARSRLHELMHLNDEVSNYFMIPFHYRKTSNDWHNAASAGRKCLIDRERFIKSFPLEAFKECKSFALVKDFVQARLAA
ncbi:MAG: hypothetical protein IPP83_12800 [Flavobacteriales bacterium]|nr:hypothetical protein [Flavobacteriales bacterium]